MLTHEEIEAIRREDYKTLGRFLGVADMIANSEIWQLSPEEVRTKMLEIRADYLQKQGAAEAAVEKVCR